jgi:hypothetical protein
MKLLLRLGALSLLLSSASCGTDAPVDPSAAAQFNFSSSKLEQLARYEAGSPQITTGVVVKVIGPEGGSLAVGGFEIIVPPGAVESATPFSIRLPVEPQSPEFVRAHFGPNRDFLVPVTIRLPMQGTTAESDSTARILWWNVTEWVPFETTLTGDGRVETQTSHFSEYGLGSWVAKGIILGNRPCGSACAK